MRHKLPAAAFIAGLLATSSSLAVPLNTSPGLVTSNIANAASTGTTINKLAKINSSGAAVITATTDTNGAVGIVINGAGTSGVAQIATLGIVLCAFDGTATAGDYVAISSSVAGDCSDAGATQPASGQGIGVVLVGGSGAGTYLIVLRPGGRGTSVSGVSSVTNSDSTLTISPTTGAVIASLNLGNANTWTAAQTFDSGDFVLAGSSSGTTTLNAAAIAGTTTATLPSNTGTIAELNLAQTWTAVQTFTNSDIRLLGSSTGYTTLTSANSGGSNFALTFPAITDTLVTLTATQTLINKTLTSPVIGGTPSGAGASITINSTLCTLSLSCAISAGTLTSGTTPVVGTSGGVLSNSGGLLNVSTTLPSGLAATNLTLTTPTLGAASATSINGLTLTSSTGTLTITNLKTLSVSNSLTLAGTDSTTMTFPATSATVAGLGTTQTFSGIDTFSGTLNVTGTFEIGGTSVALPISLANGGSNASLTASDGGIVYSTGSALAILAGTGTASQCLLSGSNTAPTWGSCTGAAAVSSVTDSGAGTTTISPTTGAVIVAVNLANANTWTAAQTFTNSDLKLLGSSTGKTTFTSANASGTNYTLTVPAATDTMALLGATQTFSGTDTFSGTINVTGTIELGGNALTVPATCDIISSSATSCNNGNSAANNGTYTVPTGALWLDVTIIGGGGGGAGGNNASSGATAGGNTCWNTSGAACTSPVYQAGGGGPGSEGGGAAGGTISGSGTCDSAIPGGGGGGGGVSTLVSSSPGGPGGNSFLGGGGPSAANNVGTAGAANSGGGGGGGGAGASNGLVAGGGGGAGATCKVILSSLGSSYTYAIGAGGTAGTAGASSSNGGGGATGHIIVTAHFNY